MSVHNSNKRFLGLEISTLVQISLAIGTWVLVLGTIYNNNKMQDFAAEQVKEYQKATRLKWRPFLNIEFADPESYFNWGLVDPIRSDTVIRVLGDIPIGSDQYRSVTYFRYGISRRLKLINTGATPLRIVGVLASTFSQQEWEKKYMKSAEALVDSIQGFDEWLEPETDIILMNDSSFTTNEKLILRTMPRDNFEGYLNKGELILYPYAYVEYADNFDNIYNALIILHSRLKIITNSDSILSFPDSAKLVIEKYRWDIPISVERKFPK